MTEIEVEEADLSGEGKGDTGEGRGDGRGRIFGSLVDIVADIVRFLVSRAVGHGVARVRRRLRILAFLALAFLVIGTLASVVWLLVGVAFLVERFPAAADPLVFVAGGVVGYLVAVVAGLVYSG